MITYPISGNFCEKRFFGMLSDLQFSIFLVFSFIEDFLFISFQQKNEIKKGNTLMVRRSIDDISNVPRFFRKNRVLSTVLTSENLFLTVITSGDVFPTVISDGNVFPTVITSGSNVFPTAITSENVFPTVITSGNVLPTVITSGNVLSTVITSGNNRA